MGEFAYCIHCPKAYLRLDVVYESILNMGASLRGALLEIRAYRMVAYFER